MSRAQVIFGPILNPRAGGKVDFIPAGALACDDAGTIDHVGPAASLPDALASSRPSRTTEHLILPPFRDDHIHIPQHPIRGHFMDGVGASPPEGRLLAGLNRNVFPAEARCADLAFAEQVVRDFAADTLSKGVVGGSAYMTVHERATHVALELLGEHWSVGLVLMEMNCPAYLRVDADRVDDQMRELAARFGERFIVTDRFAVAVGSELRRQAARVATDCKLRTQTHLNEQLSEKAYVEKVLYPGYASYTDVYRRDGLLDARCIVAHCIHMTPAEIEILVSRRALVAHCPTSNTLLCSGIMPLDRIVEAGLDYRICTDVGASPTTSMLAEMAQFLKVHANRSKLATPSEALRRTAMEEFIPGRPMSFIEVKCGNGRFRDADDAILRGLLDMTQEDLDRYVRPGPHRQAMDQLAAGALDCGSNLNLLERDVRDTAARLEDKVISVTLDGREIWRRNSHRGV